MPDYKVLQKLVKFCSVYFHPMGKCFFNANNKDTTQLAFTCSKLATETLEQGVKYLQS